MESSAKLFIEQILPESELLALSSEADRRMVAGFGIERRRREALMWRYILRRELGADIEISYNEVGAPQITNRTEYIGISHSNDHVAVIISHNRCAVDIERLDRNFEGVTARYLHPEEQALSSDERLSATIWSAKETLYKFSGKRGLDFMHEIRVLEVDFENGILVGQIEEMQPIRMQFEFHSGNIVVYIA
ncbi:MAG: 4'-phosphopantetheinyl transferase superfamily protein [Alistipes sp.]|nr:4'-phosphopantetheinyl transferase superfamily protein [Alistipes sp.]